MYQYVCVCVLLFGLLVSSIFMSRLLVSTVTRICCARLPVLLKVIPGVLHQVQQELSIRR